MCWDIVTEEQKISNNMEWDVICIENLALLCCSLVGISIWLTGKIRIIFMKKNISFHEEKYFLSWK